MATAARDKVQKWAPALPKELRAKTGKGIPYLQFGFQMGSGSDIF